MLSISNLSQQLHAFSPVTLRLLEPECKLSQTRNGLPATELPLEYTAYIAGPEELKKLSLLSELPPHILYLIIPDSDGCIPDTAGTLENCLLLPPDTSRTALYRTLRTLFWKEQRIDEAYRRFSCCLLERASLDKIMEIAEEVLENPLFLSDTSTRVLKFSNTNSLRNVEDELIRCILKHGFVLPKYFQKYNYNTLLTTIEQSSGAFFLKSEYEEKRDRIIVKLHVNGRYFGWLVLYPLHGEFQEGDCEIMDILANVLSLELERNKIGFSLSCRENLLMDLLSGQLSSPEEFCKRAESFDWIPGTDFYIMAIAFKDRALSSEKARTITVYKNHLALIYPTYKAVCVNNMLFLLLETDNLEAAASNLENFFKSYHLVVGCSEHFSNLMDFKKYCEEARDILRVGTQMNPEESVYQYSDYYLYYLVSVLKKNGDLKSFCLPELFPLIRSDLENNTCYIETIQAYLRSRNTLTAAGELHIHRNTLNYRLQKIEELTKLNLNKGDDLHKLWLSFLILEAEPSLVQE